LGRSKDSCGHDWLPRYLEASDVRRNREPEFTPVGAQALHGVSDGKNPASGLGFAVQFLIHIAEVIVEVFVESARAS
jgi:hypothetical protein